MPKTADISRAGLSRLSLAKACAGVVILFIALFLLTGYVGEKLGEHLPDSLERLLSQQADFMVSERPEADDLQRIQGVFTKITEGEDLREIGYRLTLVDLGAPNAFAMPGGIIAVTPELLEMVETEIGLAFVIAHEIGHHEHRHVTKGMGHSLLLALVFSWFSEGAAGAILSQAQDLASRRYSRQAEREADDFAIQLILRKYGTLTGAGEFFQKIAEISGESEFSAYFSTHPQSRERLKRIEGK